jgi:hypothetical protein
MLVADGDTIVPWNDSGVAARHDGGSLGMRPQSRRVFQPARQSHAALSRAKSRSNQLAAGARTPTRANTCGCWTNKYPCRRDMTYVVSPAVTR